MESKIRVFIGSSSEAKSLAEDVEAVLLDLGVDARVWWRPDVFPAGPTIIELLEEEARNTDAAVLVATADDQTTIRGNQHTTPRDNVTFEAGLFIGAHGRQQTAIAEGVIPGYLQTSPECVTSIYLTEEKTAMRTGVRSVNILNPGCRN